MTCSKLSFAAVVMFSLAASAGDLRGSAQAGKVVFAQNCTVCHGPQGKGDGAAAAGLNPRPADFTDQARQRDMTEARQLSVVTAGGASQKLSPIMPAFGDSLTDQQIKDVVAFVRETFHAREVSQK